MPDASGRVAAGGPPTRREALASIGGLVGGGLLAGCTEGTETPSPTTEPAPGDQAGDAHTVEMAPVGGDE